MVLTKQQKLIINKHKEAFGAKHAKIMARELNSGATIEKAHRVAIIEVRK